MRRITLAIIAALVVGALGCSSKEKTGMKIYVQQGLNDKAILQGTKALAQNENDGDTHYFMGVAYYQKDKALTGDEANYVDSSAVWLAKAFDHFTKAKQLAETNWGVSADENIVSMYGTHFNNGIRRIKDKDFEAAADEFKLATIADPDNYQGYYQHAQALLGLANAAKKLDRTDEFMALTDVIVKDLDKVLEIDPQDKDVTVTVHQAKGEVLFERGDLPGAQESYKKAVQLSPENYTLVLTMADRFYNAEEWEAAAGYYGDALSIKERLNLIDKKDIPVYGARGSCLSKLNRRAEALDAFEKALALDPTDTGSLYNLMVTRYKAGEEAEKGGDMATAKQFYSQAIPLGDQLIGLEPARPEYWQVRGLCKRGVGDFAGAARDLKEYQDLKGGSSGQ